MGEGRISRVELPKWRDSLVLAADCSLLPWLSCVEISGLNPEKIINCAIQQGIKLWEVRRVSSEIIICKVAAEDFKHFRTLVKKTGCRTKFLPAWGYPFLSSIAAQAGLALRSGGLFLPYIFWPLCLGNTGGRSGLYPCRPGHGGPS